MKFEECGESLIEIIEYSSVYEEKWDEFVLKKSVNGTFLQTRRFLNYHPKERFKDASLMACYKDHIIAVCPACVIEGERGTELYSHKGSTFGGLIIDKSYYRVEKLLQIIKVFDVFFAERYCKVTLKVTSNVFCTEKTDLLEYLLGYMGFNNYAELNLVLDLEHMNENVVEDFDRNKKRNISKCEEHGLNFRELKNEQEVMSFHKLLAINLSKYKLNPIHTAEELIEFRNVRLPNNTRFYGVFKDNEMMAAGMMFVFEQTNVIHAQNLSADYRFKEYSPVTYLYYKVIEKAKRDGYRALSWGISTEEQGKIINFGLVRNKEAYGSKYELNRTFYKYY